jgi:hypothetical protein
MTEERFAYNPFDKNFVECGYSHTSTLNGKGDFWEYIRGIIVGNKIYLRLYYPFEDLNDLTETRLYQKSRTLLEQYRDKIIKEVKKHYGVELNDIEFNVENDLLKGIGLANI